MKLWLMLQTGNHMKYEYMVFNMLENFIYQL